MRVKRTKTFGKKYDPMPPPEKQFTSDPNIEREYGVKLKIAVYTTKRFDDDLARHYSVEKKIIRDFKKDIIKGYLYYDGPAGGNTHYLGEFSKDGDHHALSKCINSIDRLNYLVYEPELTQDDNGNYVYLQRVVLTSCKEHYGYGVRNYSEIDDITSS